MVDAGNRPLVLPLTRWQSLVLWATGLLILLLYAGTNRPVRLDEMVQMALAGLPVSDAWFALTQTLGNSLNHGQTGTYFIADYVLLNIFGANLIALRLPSILSAAVMLAAAIIFLRQRGLSFVWQWFVLIAFAAQYGLMFYTGDARPYMVIAASAVAVLAYYQFPTADRTRPFPLMLGVFGFYIGALNHPYFIVFAVLVCSYSLWLARHDNRATRDLRGTVRFLNPWMVAPALAVYAVLGAVTWLTGNPAHGKDPWQPFDGSAANGFAAFVAQHVPPVGLLLPGGLALVTTGMLVLGVLLVNVIRRIGWGTAAPPVILWLMGVGSSLLITSASVLRDYWVFGRQWVGGMALATIALVWLLGAAYARLAPPSGGRARLTVVGIAAIYIAVSVLAAGVQVSSTLTHRDYWAVFATASPGPLPDTRGYGDRDWERYANANIASGGPVWSGLSRFYDYWVPELAARRGG